MTNPERYLIYLTREELHDLRDALGDAGELIDEKLECGRKYDDYDEADMELMRRYLERLERLAERLGRQLHENRG